MANKLLDLQKSDTDRVKRDETRHPVVRYLKQKENLAFNIGDILIKKIKRYGGPHQQDNWVTEMMSAQSKIPRKYIYLHENEFGVGYIKRLKADGSGTCGPMMCLADVEYGWIQYQVDPDYSDHVLLGELEKYTYNERFKKEKEIRQEINKYNRSILISTKSEALMNERIRMMKPGQRFWFNEYGMGIQDFQKYEYEVVKVYAPPQSKMLSQPCVWEVHCKLVGGTSMVFQFSAKFMFAKAFSMQKPKSLKDIHG